MGSICGNWVNEAGKGNIEGVDEGEGVWIGDDTGIWLEDIDEGEGDDEEAVKAAVMIIFVVLDCVL